MAVVRSLGLHQGGPKEEETKELHSLVLQHLPGEAPG